MADAAPKAIQVQDLPRINEISLTLAANGFGHLLNLVGLAAVLPPGKKEDPRESKDGPKDSKTTGPFARRARQVLIDLGPTFVKLGQVLSVRPDILPKDVLEEFETLQDRVPPMPVEDVQWVVERELGRPIDEVFDSFDPEPLGSASIAQVHRATLLGGHEVAVKLQRKGIAKTIQSDLHILYSLAALVENRLQLPGLHTPRAIVREFDAAINLELDFLQEMKAAERMRKHFQGTDLDVVVPKVFPQWSTRRMLVMELCEGTPMAQVADEVEPDSRRAKRLAHTLMEATYRQVFDFGFFHGDPHPGNLLVTDDDRVILLDFGVTGVLTSAMQETIINAFTSMVFRDAEMLALTVFRAGATQGRVDLREFIEELERKMAHYHGASLDDLANPTTLMEVVEMCTRFKIGLPPEFAVLSRTMTLVEGQIRALLPAVDIVEEVKPYAQRLMAKRFSPEQVAHDAARLMVQAQGHFKDLPTHVNQMLMDLESGNVQIVTKDPDAAQLREEIRSAVLRLSMAALASTFTMGAMLFLAAWSPAPFGIPIFGLLGGLLLFGGIGLFGALGVHVLFARFMSLTYWRRQLVLLLRFFSWRRHDPADD